MSVPGGGDFSVETVSKEQDVPCFCELSSGEGIRPLCRNNMHSWDTLRSGTWIWDCGGVLFVKHQEEKFIKKILNLGNGLTTNIIRCILSA